ncbi:MAG: hypothetical protein QW833_01600 [Candidatus Anstonellaceae archaeon]
MHFLRLREKFNKFKKTAVAFTIFFNFFNTNQNLISKENEFIKSKENKISSQKGWLDVQSYKEKKKFVVENQKDFYVVEGESPFLQFEEKISFDADTIKIFREIEKKYTLSEENIKKMEENVKELCLDAVLVAFEKVARVTLLDLEDKKLEYGKIKQEIYNRLKKESKDFLFHSKRAVREVLYKTQLEKDEKDMIYINYCKYLDNIISVASASELGLYNKWRKYHNSKLATEIADSLAKIIKIKKTAIVLYLEEDKPLEKIILEIENFLRELQNSKDFEAQEYAKEVKNLLDKLKIHPSKEEVYKFKENLRQKIERSKSIRKIAKIYHWYGLILPEIRIKINVTLPSQNINFFEAQNKVNMFLDVLIAHYEENGIFLSSKAVKELVLKKSDQLEDFKIFKIRDLGSNVIFLLHREIEKKEILDPNFRILFPAYFILNPPTKVEIYKNEEIKKYSRKIKEVQNSNSISQNEGLQTQINPPTRRSYKENKKPFLYLVGKSQNPLIQNKKESVIAPIKVDETGSIKNLFSYFNSIGLNLELDKTKIGAYYLPYAFGKIENSNLTFEINNTQLLGLNFKRTDEKKIENNKIILREEFGILYLIGGNKKIEYGDLNITNFVVPQDFLNEDILYYLDFYFKFVENFLENTTVEPSLRISVEKFLEKNSVMEIGLSIENYFQLYGFENKLSFSSFFNFLNANPKCEFRAKAEKKNFFVNCFIGIEKNILEPKFNRYINKGGIYPNYTFGVEVGYNNFLIRNFDIVASYSSNYFGLICREFVIAASWKLGLLY